MLSHPTAHRYLNLLETGCLITRIRIGIHASRDSMNERMWEHYAEALVIGQDTEIIHVPQPE